jgi:hypothetical protein
MARSRIYALPRADRAFSSGGTATAAQAVGCVCLVLALCSLLLVRFGIHPILVAALFVGLCGLSADAYFEMRHALAVARGDKSKDTRKGIELLLGILKQAPASAKANYIADLMILVLVFISLKFGDVPRSQRFALVVALFIFALSCIMFIWAMRRAKK